jgi:hypothetical protein
LFRGLVGSEMCIRDRMSVKPTWLRKGDVVVPCVYAFKKQKCVV